MSTVALIPARGGSKRFPRKNIAQLLGKPMLVHAIDVAKQTGSFDAVIVSTEDAEIAQVALEHGAEVIDRPAEYAQDRSTVVEVCLHAIEARPAIRELCCIYATAVLLRPETVVAARALLYDGTGADHVMGVSSYEHPPVQALKADADGFLDYMWPEWRGIQSQQQPKLVVSNGTFYWSKALALRKERTFYGKRLRGFEVPFDEVSDIDTEEDMEKLLREFEYRARSAS